MAGIGKKSVKYTCKKHQKLRKNKNFQAVYKCGKSYANRYMVLYVLFQSQKETQHRVGFVAGKKVGIAVVRNRVKRLMKEAYRLNQGRITSGVDLIFLGRNTMVAAGYQTTEQALLELVGRAKLLKDTDHD